MRVAVPGGPNLQHPTPDRAAGREAPPAECGRMIYTLRHLRTAQWPSGVRRTHPVGDTRTVTAPLPRRGPATAHPRMRGQNVREGPGSWVSVTSSGPLHGVVIGPAGGGMVAVQVVVGEWMLSPAESGLCDGFAYESPKRSDDDGSDGV